MVQWRFDQADFTALRLVGYPFSLRLVSVSGPCSPITSQVFLPNAFSRELQTQQPVINFTGECTVLIELRFWFKVVSEWGYYSPKESYRLLHSYTQEVWTLSVKLLRDLSIPSFRTKRIWDEPENLNAEGPWHTGSVLAFPSLDGNALLSAGRRDNATHSWKWHNICIRKPGQVWWKLLGSSALRVESG